MAELAEIGARSVPVVRRGDDFMFGQDLRAVAAFIGVTFGAERLPPPLLIERLCRLLDTGAAFTRALPPDHAETLIPGRADRAFLDLGYQMATIMRGLPRRGRGRRAELPAFRAAAAQGGAHHGPGRDDDGRPAGRARPLAAKRREPFARDAQDILWRAAPAWRAGAHRLACRATCAAARVYLRLALGVGGETRLSERELAGLPLPEAVWDKEIGAA